MELPDDLEIPLLGTDPKESKTGVRTDMCAHTFTAAVFTSANRGKPLKCPSTDDG